MIFLLIMKWSYFSYESNKISRGDELMSKIEFVLNKSYVVVDFRNNQIVHFTGSIEKATEVANLDKHFIVYSITNNITCYSR